MTTLYMRIEDTNVRRGIIVERADYTALAMLSVGDSMMANLSKSEAYDKHVFDNIERSDYFNTEAPPCHSTTLEDRSTWNISERWVS
jgi:hypothetical protein